MYKKLTSIFINVLKISKTAMLFIQYILLHSLNHDLQGSLFQGMWILMKVSSMNLTQLYNSEMCLPRIPHSLAVPLDIVTYSLINARCNENCIITYCTFILFPRECVVHDYVLMFHVYDKLE